jgi:hypothetical protein
MIFLTSGLAASFSFFILMKGMVSNEVSLKELGNLHTRVGVQIYVFLFQEDKGSSQSSDDQQ